VVQPLGSVKAAYVTGTMEIILSSSGGWGWTHNSTIRGFSFRLREDTPQGPARILSRAFCLSGTRLINLCCSYGREGDARLETHDEDGVVREAWQQGCAGPLVLLAATSGEA
jgi:hypothetical protein